MRVCIAGTGGPVYRSRQLPRFIVTAVGQHLCETVHVLLVGSATAPQIFNGSPTAVSSVCLPVLPVKKKSDDRIRPVPPG